ncbi:MAG: class I SAM-dependent methyltransferase [Ignavibacteriae bacterium]|nr:class I SAM-dependent methyltransferase [Ignavibacteriota bacterium]
MNVKDAYNSWSEIYDTNENKTRDLEAKALSKILNDYTFDNCLEIGCGTGKNTEFLITKAKQITAVDLSEKMLEKAKQKVHFQNVIFLQADITKSWDFISDKFDLITFSLVLEHIENLEFIFSQIIKVINKNGFVYIGELHPLKQYSGTKARFESEDGLQIVNCFDHHISDFAQFAIKYNFEIVNLNEYFDNNDRTNLPRIITFLLKSKN